MTELIVRIEEYDEDIRGSWDPDDQWDAPDQQYRFEGVYVQVKRLTDQYSTHELEGVSRGDYVYVITANYDSGSSFHQSYGHTCLVSIHKTEEEAVSRYETWKEFPRGTGGEYMPWMGYFEKLNHFDMHVVRVD